MRLASRSARAAAALRRARPPLGASPDLRGRRGGSAPWLRCRAQSAARSRSRSTGKRRPAADSRPHRPSWWSAAPGPLRGVGVEVAAAGVPGSPRGKGGEGARDTGPGAPGPRGGCDGALERGMARGLGSASSSPRTPVLLMVLSPVSLPGATSPTPPRPRHPRG